MVTLKGVLDFQNGVTSNISDLKPYTVNPNLRELSYEDMCVAGFQLTKVLVLKDHETVVSSKKRFEKEFSGKQRDTMITESKNSTIPEQEPMMITEKKPVSSKSTAVLSTKGKSPPKPQTETATIIQERKNTVKQTFLVYIESIYLVVLYENQSCYIPILNFQLNIKDWSAQFIQTYWKVNMKVSIQSEFYQPTIGKWEPVIERCTFDTQFIRDSREHQKAIGLVAVISHDVPQLSINFSPEMYHVLNKTLQSYHVVSKNQESRTDHLSYSPDAGTGENSEQKEVFDNVLFDSRFAVRNL